jgi:hypothetical protein
MAERKRTKKNTDNAMAERKRTKKIQTTQWPKEIQTTQWPKEKVQKETQTK